MSWLGIEVLPRLDSTNMKPEVMCQDCKSTVNPPTGEDHRTRYGHLLPPPSPLLKHTTTPYQDLTNILLGSEAFEHKIQYTFRDKSYLLQAFMHASYYPNQLVDCYQRLEFLGDAVLGM